MAPWLLGLVLIASPLTPVRGAPECVPAARTVIADLPWAQEWLRPQEAWPLTQGAGVTVAIVSTGIDANAAQLAGRVDPGVDLATGGRADNDCEGHGTFMAGLIAAAPVAGVGFSGVAPHVRVLPIRGEPAAGVAAAVQRGATVILVTGAALSLEPVGDAVIVTAGPAPKGVLGVGGFGPGGVLVKDVVGVDILAPGADLLSTGTGGPGHVTGSGSAYAAAYVAGVAALVRARHPHLTAAQVRQRLLDTADQGYIDLYAAVAEVIPSRAIGSAPTDRPVIDRPHRTDNPAFELAAGVAASAYLAIAVIFLMRRRRHDGSSAV